MREYINVDVLTNLVVMLRADVDGAIWLSADDNEARFYEGCAHKLARVVSAPEVLFPLLSRVESRGIHGVIATSRGIRPPHTAPNVFQPTLGDVASLLLSAESSGRVIQEICGNAWFTACQKEIGSICSRAAWITRILSKLREACLKEKIAPPESLDFFQIIDWNSFDIAWEKLSSILLSSGLSQESIDQLHEIKPGKDLRFYLDSNGADAIQILATATKMYRPRGISALRQIEADEFIGMLRISYNLSEFEQDDIFWHMRRWERTNSRYPMLREWRMLDPLGMVWDQRYWQNDLVRMISMLKPDEPMTLVQMDLDNFGVVNKKLGHMVGDEAIRFYCKIVKRTFGGVGEIYRRGGDELVILAPGLSESMSKDLAERTRINVENMFKDWSNNNGADPAPTASIGVAVLTEEKTNSKIIELADKAQKQAKEQGKNRVVILP